MVICLERGANLHIVQLIPLPLTVSCFSKIQIAFTFLVPAHLGSPGKMAVKRVCVCVCVCLYYVIHIEYKIYKIFNNSLLQVLTQYIYVCLHLLFIPPRPYCTYIVLTLNLGQPVALELTYGAVMVSNADCSVGR